MSEPVEDPEGVLSEATGLSREDVRKTWADAQANAKLLRECPGPHNFVAESDPPMRRVSRYRCTICGGTVNSSAAKWYEDGLRHGRMDDNANDHA